MPEEQRKANVEQRTPLPEQIAYPYFPMNSDFLSTSYSPLLEALVSRGGRRGGGVVFQNKILSQIRFSKPPSAHLLGGCPVTPKRKISSFHWVPPIKSAYLKAHGILLLTATQEKGDHEDGLTVTPCSMDLSESKHW